MKTKGFVQSLLLTGVLAAGFAAVWGVVSLWALEVGTHVVAGITSNEVVIIPRAALLFLPDGTPVVSYQTGGRHRQLRDLQGNPVAEPDGEHPFLNPVTLPVKFNSKEGIAWDQRIRSFADGRVPSGYWYFIADGRPGGTGYFVGYDSENHSCLGYLGTAGLREGPLSAEELIPFEGAASHQNGRVFCTQRDHDPTEHPRHRSAGRAPHGSVSTWDVYIHDRDGKLYHADLQKRTMQVAFDSATVLSAALTAGVPDAVHGTPYRPTIRTEDAVLLLDEHGEVLKHYPIPASLRGQDIHYSETNTGEAVMYGNSPEDILASEVEYRICQVDSAGRCRQTATVLPFIGMERLIPMAGLVIPSPLGLAGTVASVRPSMLLDDNLAITYPEALGRALTEFWPALAIAQMIALAFAVLCYRRQVRYGVSRAECIVWPLFVLLLGLPGWIGYRFGRSWPVLETCPACGGVVPRDRGDCARCAAEFPLPALKGTEVFAG
jgi:hypothetical protein